MTQAEQIVEASGETAKEFLQSLGSIGLWLQAIGIIIIIWIIVQIINWLYNIKRIRNLSSIKEDLERIEKKIDKVTRYLHNVSGFSDNKKIA